MKKRIFSVILLACVILSIVLMLSKQTVVSNTRTVKTAIIFFIFSISSGFFKLKIDAKKARATAKPKKTAEKADLTLV